MSLADLSDNLIAHLCSYLNYPDICNLMETSKRNYNVIKDRKLDKMEVDNIRLSQCNLYSDKFYYKKTRKWYNFNKLDSSDVVHVTLKKMLNECSSLNSVKIKEMDFTRELFNVLNETKAKIDRISFKNGSVDLSPDEFAKLCKKFKNSEFIRGVFTDGIWNDKILVQVVLQTNIEKDRSTPYITATSVKPITDLTLMALVGKEEHQNRFKIPGIRNLITIKGIVSVLQKFKNRSPEYLDWYLDDEPYVRARRPRLFYEDDYSSDDNIQTLGDFHEESYQDILQNSFWDLGILQKNQLEDANRYFNKTTGELKHLYKITIDEGGYQNKYVITLPKNLVEYLGWNSLLHRQEVVQSN